MTSLVEYLWCIYSLLFLTTNGQSASSNACLWGCSELPCTFMNGLFYTVSPSIQAPGGKRYYKQDNRDFTSCTQVYFIYWYAGGSEGPGWYVAFGEGDPVEFGNISYNIIQYIKYPKY